MPSLLVPSDVALLEERYALAQPRRLTVCERLGLLGSAPILLQLRHAKLDRGDLRRILTKKYDPAAARSDEEREVVQILQERQKSVRKRVLTTTFMWAGVVLGYAFSSYGFRRYEAKSRIIVLPFVAYGMSWVGRWTGELCTGRWSEYRRQRILGQLPAKTYFVSSVNGNGSFVEPSVQNANGAAA